MLVAACKSPSQSGKHDKTGNPMNENVLKFKEKDGVVLLTLNRPKVMNSFNFALLHALKEQIDALRFRHGIGWL